VLKIDTADHSTGKVPDRQGERVPFAPMMRRSFRIGLRLGLLFGGVVALVKTVQSRRTAAAVPPPAPWEPIVETPRPAAPEPERRAEPVPVPEVPVPAAGTEPLVDEVGEPIMEPAPPVDHDPALDIVPEPATEVTSTVKPPHRSEDAAPAGAPVKKVAAKKLPAAKKAAAPRKAAAAKKASKAAPAAPFVDPDGGVCPTSHPVKAKLASRLFHLPGMFAYDRTRPDRCYRDAGAAVADGFVQAKR
jgi:hypothetical protein